MKKIYSSLVVPIIIAAAPSAFAQESNFSASLELASKYMWRGQEYGNAPVLFPTLEYGTAGFFAGATGAYTTNGSFSECDLYLGYGWNGLSLTFTDYFYPSESGTKDDFFNFNNKETGHSVEATLSYEPETLPFWASVSSIFWGDDKNGNGKQAYSSYFELGAYYDFTDNDKISFTFGSSFFKGFYTNFEKSFAVVNLDLTYEKTLTLGPLEVPVSCSYIINPYLEKSFLTFSIAFGI